MSAISRPCCPLAVRLLIFTLCALLFTAPAAENDSGIGVSASGSWVTFDFSAHHLTGKAADRHPVVRLDASLESGPVLSASGETVGTFQFPALPESAHPAARLLRVAVPAIPPPTETNQYFFLATSAADPFVFVGVSDWPAQAELVLDSGFLRRLAWAFFSPEKLNTAELMQLLYWTEWNYPMKGQTFFRGFVPVLARQFIRLAAEDRLNPAAPEEPGFAVVTQLRMMSTGSYMFELPGAETEQIALALANDWPRLSTPEKLLFLEMFESVDRRTATVAAALFLDQIRAAQRGEVSEYEAMQLLRKLEALIRNLSLDQDLFLQLGVESARLIARYPGSFLIQQQALFTLRQFVEMDRGLLDSAEFAAVIPGAISAIDEFFQIALANNRETVVAASGFLYGRFYRFLTESQRAAYYARFQELLTGTVPHIGYTLLNQIGAQFLLGPHTEEDIRRLGALLLDPPLSSDSPSLEYAWLDWAPVGNLQPVWRDRILPHMAAQLLQRLPSERPARDDFTFYDSYVQQALGFLKKTGLFAESHELFLPLLRAYNPRQPEETEEAYAARYAQVEALFKTERLFLIDLSGSLIVRPEHLPVLFEYARTHPDWLNMVVLTRLDGGTAEGKPGAAQFNIASVYVTPHSLMLSLLHEGGHSWHFHPRTGIQQPLIETIPIWWHRQSGSANPQRFVSDYSTFDWWEFWAENTRYFHREGPAWLRTALEDFAAGQPALLNLFVYIWNLPAPANAAAPGARPIYKLLESGSLETTWTPAGWKSGSILEGVFEFEFEGARYSLAYRDRQIQELRKDGQLLRANNRKPALLYPSSIEVISGEARRIEPLSASDPDAADAVLRYELLIPWPGVSLDSQSGAITVAENAAPATNYVAVRMWDSGSPSMDQIAGLTVARRALRPPRVFVTEVWAFDTDQEVAITDFYESPDLPLADLEFALTGAEGAIGRAIDSERGVIRMWALPGTLTSQHILTLSIRSRTKPLEASQSFRVSLTRHGPPNTAPFFTIADRFELPYRTPLILPNIARDNDLPANQLAFEFLGTSYGAQIDSAGNFDWSAARTHKAGSYRFVVRVTDNGIPPLSAEFAFDAVIGPRPESRLAVQRPSGGVLALEFEAVEGEMYEVESSNDLVSWRRIISGTAQFSGMRVTTPMPAEPSLFYRIRFR